MISSGNPMSNTDATGTSAIPPSSGQGPSESDSAASTSVSSGFQEDGELANQVHSNVVTAHNPGPSAAPQIRGVEQVIDGDGPPAPIELDCLDDDINKLAEHKKSNRSKIVELEEIEECDGPPLPIEELFASSSKYEEKKPNFSSNINGLEQVGDSDEPPQTIDQIAASAAEEEGKGNSSKRVSPSERVSNFHRDGEIGDDVAPTGSSQSTANPVSPTRHIAPPSAQARAPLEPSSSSENPSFIPPMFFEVEATLVTPEPPASIYDAVAVPPGEAASTEPSQPESFCKRHFRFLVGGATLLFLAMAGTIGAFVSDWIKDDDGSQTTTTSTATTTSTTTTTVPDSPSNSTPIFPSTFNLYAWGDQKNYGKDSDGVISIPTSMDEEVVDVSAGSRYSIILLPDGTARSAGGDIIDDEYLGWLGVLGATTEGVNPFRDISQVIDTESETTIDAPPFKKVFAGYKHSLLIDLDGNAWTTGSNKYGELCVGYEKERMIPRKIPIEGKIVDAAVGESHTLLLHENGTAYGCGLNHQGPLGLGDVYSVSEPTKIEGLGFVESVSTGYRHSLFLSSDGLHVTGYTGDGRLCVDTGGEDIKTVLTLSGINRDEVVSFEASKSSSYILFKNGTVFACGWNMQGQLGDGTNDNKVQTTTLTPTPIKQLGVGPEAGYAFFIDYEGVVYATGRNEVGELGVGDYTYKNVPAVVKFSDDADVEHISAGWGLALAMLKTKGNRKT